MSCALSDLCARCRSQREPGTNQHHVPVAPGPVGLWMLDGWWQASAARSSVRGLQFELGTRAVGALRMALRAAVATVPRPPVVTPSVSDFQEDAT